MAEITGNAKKHDGTAIDYVSIFSWSSGKLLEIVVPDEAGGWSYTYDDFDGLNIGITYIADGCEPLTHGAYAAAGFDPFIVFDDGKKGGFYDPSDLSTLFQDAAGTIPVTASNQPVGLMLDKSGNNWHASQPVNSSRPIYKTSGEARWLSFDGNDDFMKINHGISSINHILAVAVNLRHTNVEQMAILESYRDNNVDPQRGTRLLYAVGNFYHQLRDASKAHSAILPRVDKAVLLAQSEGVVSKLWVNNGMTSKGNDGEIAANDETFIGMSSGVKWPARMDFYGAMMVEGLHSDDLVVNMRRYFSGLMG